MNAVFSACADKLAGMVTCPHCHTSNRPLAKFCMKCVASLEAATSLPGGPAATRFEHTEHCERTIAATRFAGERPAPPTQAFSEHALPDGTLIEGFRIVRPIGEGGFGIVYLAWDAALERQVAIKEYLPSSLVARAASSLDVTMRSPRFRETFEVGRKSFVNEARLLARFDHPALIKVFRFWEANGTAYMAMPYCEGPTLKDALADLRGTVTEAQLREWLDPLLDALAVLHRESCFHRDISPDNILLTAAGPLLLDFGAARRVISDMTQALTAVLKPGFAPIEQYGGGLPQGPWTDLYALAGVVYYAITGRPPLASAVRAVNDTVRPLAESHAGRFGADFLRAIDSALSVRPEGRPQDVAQFRALLQKSESPAAAAANPRTAAVAPNTSTKPIPSRLEALSVEPLATATVQQAMRVPEAEPAAASPRLLATAAVHQQPDPARRARRGLWPMAGVAAAVVMLAAGGAWMWGGRPVSPPQSLQALQPAQPSAAHIDAKPETVAGPALAPTPAPQPAPAVASTPAPAPALSSATGSASVAPSLRLQNVMAVPAPVRDAPRKVAASAPQKTSAALPVAKGQAAATESESPKAESRRQPAREPEVVSYNKEQPRPTRCTDVVLKSSLEPLSSDETDFLKKNCR